MLKLASVTYCLLLYSVPVLVSRGVPSVDPPFAPPYQSLSAYRLNFYHKYPSTLDSPRSRYDPKTTSKNLESS